MPGAGRPLGGLRVVVTRPREQAGEFIAALERSGAEPLVFPATRIVPPADPEPLRRAVRNVVAYDWIVFTSANGVRSFWQALEEEGAGARDLAGVRFACVGPSTAAALAERGAEADVVPPRYVGGAIADALAAAHGSAGVAGGGAAPLSGVRVLLPLAAGAADVLEAGLMARGARVDRVEAYRSVPDLADAEGLRRKLAAGGVDVVTFTSPSTVEAFVDAVGADTGGAIVAVIGPVTADAARRRGLRVEVVASEHTTAGLVRALMRRYGREPGPGGGV
ncbi:MAG TPA: uroporphyrinogen-III synthase [Longimicrobiales bacterium]